MYVKPCELPEYMLTSLHTRAPLVVDFNIMYIASCLLLIQKSAVYSIMRKLHRELGKARAKTTLNYDLGYGMGSPKQGMFSQALARGCAFLC